VKHSLRPQAKGPRRGPRSTSTPRISPAACAAVFSPGFARPPTAHARMMWSSGVLLVRGSHVAVAFIVAQARAADIPGSMLIRKQRSRTPAEIRTCSTASWSASPGQSSTPGGALSSWHRCRMRGFSGHPYFEPGVYSAPAIEFGHGVASIGNYVITACSGPHSIRSPSPHF